MLSFKYDWLLLVVGCWLLVVGFAKRKRLECVTSHGLLAYFLSLCEAKSQLPKSKSQLQTAKI